MTRLLLIITILCISSSALGQDDSPKLIAPNPSPTPKASPETTSPESTQQSEASPQSLGEAVLRDMTSHTNLFLEEQSKDPLTPLEIQEVSNIIDGWSNPVKASIFIYLIIFSAILAHAFRHKRYKWLGGMAIFGFIANTLIWLPPLSYTRRHIFPGILSQQLPVVLIQILPTFVWWSALADIGHWFQRIMMSRGLG